MRFGGLRRHGRPGRHGRPDVDDMDGLTLRFIDPKREEGFVLSHGPRLSSCMDRGIVIVAIVGFVLVLATHKPWNGAQYAQAEAQELSRWHMFLHAGSCAFLAITLGFGRLMAKCGVFSTWVLEILVVFAHCCAIAGVVISPKHYLARAFGYDDPEAIWEVDLGGTDGNLVLWIDIAVTALHI